MRREEDSMPMDELVASPVHYRKAIEADLAAQHAVFVAAEGELLARHRFAWSPPPLERLEPGFRHMLATDRERCFVAEADGRVVGYSAAFVRGDVAFLASLFIHPDVQGRGIGRRLFGLALEGSPSRRMTISDAIQPVSNALYARNGLLPTTPVLGFEGEPAEPGPSGLIAAEPDAASLAALDEAGYGFDRALDHPFWATQAIPTLWRFDGAAVAYSYRWPNGRIGPLVGRDPAMAARALRAELALGGPVSVEIPGSSRSLVAAALAAELRLEAPPGLLLIADGLAAPTTLAISSYGLM
jgi:GNAT superfamily N-acetyltransferase